jgi:hypothetical protein
MKARTSIATLFVCFTLARAAAAAPPAHEPTPEEVERARTFYNAASSAYSAARYADAARGFEQAYLLAPRPQLLFSLAQAERKDFFASGDVTVGRRALEHYKHYLEQVASGGRRSEATEARADLEARLSRLDPNQAAASAPAEKRKARVTVYSPTPGAHVSLDGAPPQEVPFFSELEPGKHRLVVSAEGFFDEERDVSGDNAIDQPVDLTLKERPALVTVALDAKADVYVDGRVVATTPLSRPIEVPSGPHVIAVSENGKRPFSQDVVLARARSARIEPKLETSGQRIVSLAMLGVGAASLLASGGFAIAALAAENEAKDVERHRANGNIKASDFQSHNDAVDRQSEFRTVSIVALSAGSALAVGGALLYIVDKPSIPIIPPRTTEPGTTPRPKEPMELGVYPILAPTVAGAGLGARF